MSHIDGLITDIMKTGTPPGAKSREIISPGLLIEYAVSDIGRMFPSAVKGMTYDLKYPHHVLANAQKSRRGFSNILLVRDFGRNDHIWFKTREIEKYVEFCIANSRSQIP